VQLLEALLTLIRASFRRFCAGDCPALCCSRLLRLLTLLDSQLASIEAVDCWRPWACTSE
jgi:hypothetical protein